jgi:hypothetical protein
MASAFQPCSRSSSSSSAARAARRRASRCRRSLHDSAFSRTEWRPYGGAKGLVMCYRSRGQGGVRGRGRSLRDVGAGAPGGLKQRTFCMARRKTMITMGSPYFVWINANEIISSWYLLDAVCVPPPPWRTLGLDEDEDRRPHPLDHCPGRRPFSIVKRGRVTFCNSKAWTKQAAARGGRKPPQRAGKRPARPHKTPIQNRFS